VELLGEFGEHGCLAALGGEGGGGRLESLAQLEQGAHGIRGDGGDHETASGLRRDEPVGRETRQRFTQGGARDAESVRLLDLAEHGAGRESPLQDLAPQGLVRAVARASRGYAHALNVYTGDWL